MDDSMVVKNAEGDFPIVEGSLSNMELDEGLTYVALSTGILETEQQHYGVPDALNNLNNELLDRISVVFGRHKLRAYRAEAQTRLLLRAPGTAIHHNTLC